MVDVIVPCCGRSSRFPDLPPKWMLPGLDGRPMLAMAVEGLDVPTTDLAVLVLREHVENFDAVNGIKAALGVDVTVEVLDEPTRSQAETVAEGVRRLKPAGAFLIKDSDNYFEVDLDDGGGGFVSVDSLNNHDMINPRNKSYLVTDHNGLITNIREKEVISHLFSVGGYQFADADAYCSYFEHLGQRDALDATELYLSDIISAMILDGVPFGVRQVRGYQDWGTVTEWQRYLEHSSTLFVSLDGFVFERGSAYFTPRFEDVTPNRDAIEALRDAVGRGQSLRYLSIRGAELADLTHRQLLANDVPIAPVVFGCPITTWDLVTSPHSTLPVRSGRSFEVAPDDPNLAGKIGGGA